MMNMNMSTNMVTKEMLAAVLLIGVVSAAAGTGTLAYFNDEETSSNTFVSGSLDLLVDWEEHYNGEVVVNNTGLDDLDGELIFDRDDVKPGDYGEATISLHIDDNPGWIWMYGELTSADDVSTNQPEGLADSMNNPNNDWDGELAENTHVKMWYDDGDNIHQEDEEIFFGGEECAGIKTDAGLVIDRSGSMTTDNAMGEAQTGATTLVSSLDDSDQAALSSFNETATLDQPLTDNKTLVTAAINDLASGGWTNMADGISIMHNELTTGANARNDAQKVMVLFADGHPNRHTTDYSSSVVATRQAAMAAKNDGIRIITIGYTDSADEQFLEDLASSPDDAYYTEDVDEISTIFDTLSDEICTSATLADLNNAMANGMLLDANMSTDAAEPFAGGQTHHIGFEWHIPFEVGNELQTDESTFNLGFYGEQSRHNDNPENPWTDS